MTVIWLKLIGSYFLPNLAPPRLDFRLSITHIAKVLTGDCGGYEVSAINSVFNCVEFNSLPCRISCFIRYAPLRSTAWV